MKANKWNAIVSLLMRCTIFVAIDAKGVFFLRSLYFLAHEVKWLFRCHLPERKKSKKKSRKIYLKGEWKIQEFTADQTKTLMFFRVHPCFSTDWCCLPQVVDSNLALNFIHCFSPSWIDCQIPVKYIGTPIRAKKSGLRIRSVGFFWGGEPSRFFVSLFVLRKKPALLYSECLAPAPPSLVGGPSRNRKNPQDNIEGGVFQIHPLIHSQVCKM